MSALTGTQTAIPLRQKVGAFVELGKLRLSSLAIFAVLAGLYLGYPSFEDPPGWLVASTAIGSLAIAAAGNALNQYLERDVDPLMDRTRSRPVPSGRLTPREALVFGIVGALAGVGMIAATTNVLATLTSVAIFVTYVFVYTPMKRVSSLNTIVGAVPGALPPVVGYAAATGTLDVQAALLFGIVFLWQMPHFFAISWRYREDYARGGLKMLAVTDTEGFVLRRQMLVYTAALVLVSFLPFKTGLAGEAYLATAALLGFLFMVPVTAAALFRLESAMRLTFLASIIYLPLLFVAMVADRV
ncbi:MAG: heme o synthase [Planctomycetota bacterium]